MKIYLNNIGKIKNSTLEINGITVIAGENNTGKSTVGRSLYSVFNGFYKIEEKLKEEKKKSILVSIFRNIGLSSFTVLRRLGMTEEFNECFDKIDEIFDGESFTEYDDLDRDTILKDVLQNYINTIDMNKYYDRDTFKQFEEEKVLDHIKKIYSISNDEFVKHVLEELLITEFNGQINNIYKEEEGVIVLTIQNQELEVLIKDNEVTRISNIVPIRTEAVYIDNPFLIDEYHPIRWRHLDEKYGISHSQHLQYKLFDSTEHDGIIDKVIIENKLQKITNLLNSVCNGLFQVKGRRALYIERNRENTLDVKNLSSGLKTFVILKKLLLDNVIEENGTIILDEPEIHLHPEWQLIFAELIVLIQKEFNMHILLTTHSPYFLNAIEVYAHKHQIDDKCNYYSSRNKEEFSIIEECTENIETIYYKLARPLQDLENERYNYE